MHTLYLDLETYCKLSLKGVGAYRYAEKAEIMLVQFAWDEQPVTVWDMREDTFARTKHLKAMIKAAEVVVTHSQFDPIVLAKADIVIPVEKREDTMVIALEHGMPGSLGMLCDILEVPVDTAKIKDGKKLIARFCSPTKGVRATKETHPEEWARFLEYAANDIEAMREVRARLPRWNWTATERAYWHLDIATNDLGMQVDTKHATAALEAFQRAKLILALRTSALTNGALQATTQRAALMEHLVKVHGVEMTNLTAKKVLETLEEPDLDPVVRELLENRLKASATSPAKYRALLISSCVDGRLHGALQFCGAARTGRDAGRIFQPQNLPRATLDWVAINIGIAAMQGCYEEILFDVIELCVSAVRGAIIAAEGHTLIVSDLSNIEGRSLAWMVEETWKLDAFRAYDKGEGADIYKITAGRILGKDPKDVTKDERQQIGKISELSCGYQGAVGAFRRMGGSSVEAMSNDEISNIVRQWRARHPKTKAFWYAMEDAATSAILKPGESFSCGPITYDLKDGPDGVPYLRMRLPSGRYLCYRKPQCAAAKCIFCDGKGVVRLTPDSKYMECPECDGQGSFGEDGLTYEGVDQYSRKWKRLTTYGGKLCIAAGTPVLTDLGWIAIQDVTEDHRVWDGDVWVTTGGAIDNGFTEVIKAHGGWFTPDHELLMEEGWVHASQSAGHQRAACRLPDGTGLPRVRWEEEPLAGEVRLRCRSDHGRDGTGEAEEARHRGVLRLPTESLHRTPEDHPRHVEAPRLRGVAQYDRPLPVTLASGVGQLWRSGYQGLRAVAHLLRGLLGGYGADIPKGVVLGPNGQRRPLRTGQLPLGDNEGAASQPKAPVFDLLDCGPRNRFTIATEDGPLIVHNCENANQALARDIFFHGMRIAMRKGFRIVLRVHDELVAEVPDDSPLTLDDLSACLTVAPSWATGMPLAAAGFVAKRYKKE